MPDIPAPTMTTSKDIVDESSILHVGIAMDDRLKPKSVEEKTAHRLVLFMAGESSVRIIRKSGDLYPRPEFD
jgi:hypothetical protein